MAAGHILALYRSNINSKIRDKETVLTITEQGIVGDKYFDKDISRAVLISSVYSYQLALQQGIVMPHGYLGENILTDFNVNHLKNSDLIHIGDMTFEVLQPCTVCSSLAALNASLPKLLLNNRGIFIRPIGSGQLHVNDLINIESSHEE